MKTAPSPGRPPGPTAAPLIVRSAYSLGRGTATPSALIERARAGGLDSLALTDRDNLYGAIPFLDAAKAAGLHPVLGAEVSPRSGGPVIPGKESARGAPRGTCASPDSLILLIREAAGYASLCRILTARHLDPGFQLHPCVAANQAGLVALARDPGSLESLHPLLDRGRLYAAVVRPGRREAERGLRERARRVGRPVVGSIDVYMGAPDEQDSQRVLSAVREVDLVSRLAPDQVAPDGAWLRGAMEVFALYAEDPGLLTAGRALAFSCRFDSADLAAPGSLFPKLPLPDGETIYDRLYRMTQDGLRRRYPRVTREITRRLAWELEQIDSMGFTDYFVVVGDLCAAARARDIPTVGRGSGASSLVAYLLGITNVDPIRYRLTFERFLHRLRHDLPDLDIDLCWRRRDDVISHVYATYGADRVAMISTHNHYQGRGALREAGKAMGLTNEQVDRLAKAIPSFSDLPLRDAIRSTPYGRTLDIDRPPLPEILDAADRMLGLPHTLGIHCGGIVIGPGPLSTWTPLETATKGIVVTQYEMHAVERVGLVKIDLLGNRALSTIAETVDNIRAAGGRPPDLTALPDPDPETARILRVGDSLGCFQIESPGMRNLLRMLFTSDLEGTIAALSLIRPGPAGSGMKGRFVRRARGTEPTTYLHPSLEPLLSSTFGVLLYEEDVICVASAIGGFDRALGDLLRRAIAAASHVEADPSLGERSASDLRPHPEDPWKGAALRELENRFLACAVRNGVDADVARDVWKELARFGSYAFCKAHASGYGVLAYQTAYLKAHHPGAFYAALLNNHQGMYPLRVHVEDARRHGVSIAPPCVHRSAVGWTWDGAVLRCGLAQVRGLTESVVRAILASRADGPFADVEDFLARTGASVPEAQSLILCGGLDDVGPGPRPARLWRLHCAARRRSLRTAPAAGRPARTPPRLGLELPRRTAGGWRDFDREQRVRHEMESLDLAITDHPVAVLMERWERSGRAPSCCAAASIEREGPASVVGILSAARRVRTKKGEMMLFLTLEDATGLVECTLFPPAYARYGSLLHEGTIFRAAGIVEAQYGAPTLTVETLERLEPL